MLDLDVPAEFALRVELGRASVARDEHGRDRNRPQIKRADLRQLPVQWPPVAGRQQPHGRLALEFASVHLQTVEQRAEWMPAHQ